MEQAATELRIGDWRVDPKSGQISRDGETVRVEARTMRLLLCLAEHAGEVVSIDDLLDQVWSGVIVTPDSVYQAVASLRRLLGDDPRQPSYIATAPRLGYRMVAKVTPWQAGIARSPAGLQETRDEGSGVERTENPKLLTPRTAFLLAAAVCIAIIAVFLVRGRFANNHAVTSSALAAQPQKSVAVLPFLDLTQGMQDEEFADGMTEELIDRLSKVQGLRVPGATSSFYFKGKQIPLADIAKSLGVVYVLDGSVRKSGSTVRVAARLVRVDSGYVEWSETYDRLLRDILIVQDDIAGEVTKALQASIAAKPGAGGQ